ncbi:MAG TPA: cobalamin biosynthesis protein CobQ, partial [Isosphaeraceae bacterium]|nr:cobalamin biosynthesis protein CobQ [Isosphaeraceae bacterium]
MREVDEALARAYPQDGAIDESRAAAPPALPVPRAARAGGPHFSVAPPSALRGTAASLRWPPTIRALEREHGDRFAHLAEILLEARDTRQLKVLLFTSCHRAEGRTTLVLTLARALARRPGRTLVVDADLTGPMLGRQLGLQVTVGLDDVVENSVALADALIEAPDDNLTILPLRAPVAHPREFLTSPAWSCALAR